VLYLLTRMGEAKDWGTGLPLKGSLLGKMNRLEVHHIFPKAQLYKLKYTRPEVNALANFCFQTKETNLEISDRLPEAYFPILETRHPGALASQWIPSDPEFWKLENYRHFLEARRELLAAETNKRMAELLHGDTRWLEGPAKGMQVPVPVPIVGGITTETEEEDLIALNNWVAAQGLPRGQISCEYVDPNTGEQQAVFDLAWPEGLQEGLTQPVAVLLNEGTETLALASSAGFRCFTSVSAFNDYVTREILSQEVV
jgi:hypothetical protein